MIQLTFILPIFNTAKYLNKCIDSIIAQDLPTNEYEILLVYDEGSTDNGLEIARHYESLFSNVRVVSHSNRSIGESLNYAFPIANGKYIEVVDTDDFLEPHKIGSLIERMEIENLDILRFDYQNVNEDYAAFCPNKNPKQFIDMSETVTDGEDFLLNRMGYSCYVPTYIFRKDLLIKPGNEMLPIAINDTEWLPRIIVQAKRISSYNDVIYNYLIREGSKMHSKNQVKKNLEYRFDLIDAIINKATDNSASSKWYKSVISGTILSLYSICAKTADKDIHKSCHSLINKLKYLNLYPLSYYHMSIKNRIRIAILNISPRLYLSILTNTSREKK